MPQQRPGQRSSLASPLAGAPDKKGPKNAAAQKAAAVAVATKVAEERISAEESKKKFTRVDSFEGIFSFLNLDTPCDVAWGGVVYRSARHALLAAQYPTAAAALTDAGPSAQAARKAVDLELDLETEDWAKRRLPIMEQIQRDKFRRSESFRKQLADTGDRELVWENDEDLFWGSSRNKGQNHLGRILMEIRTSLHDNTEFETWLFLCCEIEDNEIKRPPVELLEQKFGGEDGNDILEKKVHRLSGKAYFKIGKIPANAVQALHPSVSREHAMLIHTRAKIAQRSGGLAIVDLGSKAGTTVGGRKLAHSWIMEPVRNEDVIKIGASTRSYTLKVNLASQIEQLEQQQRELMKEVQMIDSDAADPVQAAKRQAREEATVFVGNLDFETEKADLLMLFQDCGHVEETRFPGQESNKASRGICFVVFDSAMAARRAVGLSGETFKGRRVKVAPASEGGRKGDSKVDSKGDSKGDGKGKGKGKGGAESGKSGKLDQFSGSREVFDPFKNSRKPSKSRSRSRSRSKSRDKRRRGEDRDERSNERAKRSNEHRKDDVKDRRSRSRKARRSPTPQRQRSRSRKASPKSPSSSSSPSNKKRSNKKKK